MKIAVFLPNWIGDVVMATPALRALRKHFGAQSTLIGVMRPYVSDVLAGTTWLNEYIYYEPGALDRSLRSWSLIRRLRNYKLDMTLLFPNSLRTGLLAFAGGSKMRVGFSRNCRGLLLTKKLKFPKVF